MSLAKDVNTPTQEELVKKKAAKLVVAHLRKKIKGDYMGKQYLLNWLDEMEELLQKDEFDIKEYYAMRKRLNSVVETTFDQDMRGKIRNSWHSLGKALDKKVRPY